MKLIASIFLFFCFSLGFSQTKHIVYIYDSVPHFDSEILSVLKQYQLSFQSEDEIRLHANFSNYHTLDSIYGKSWLTKINSKLKNNKMWTDFIASQKQTTVVIDQWNFTKVKFFSVGLIKETETKFCAYNLNCAIKLRKYSKNGKVTKEQIKKVPHI
jgi:hypothetical protein